MSTSKRALEWLCLIVFIAFAMRTFTKFVIPNYGGYDTGAYVGNAIYYSKHLTEFPGILMSGGNVAGVDFPITPLPTNTTLPIKTEPLIYMLTAPLIALGLPVTLLPLLVIPLFSTLILIPFFLVANKILGDERTALLATAFLVISPWQFRYLSDLFNTVIASFFMMWTLYYFVSDRHVYWKNFVAVTCMMLSSTFISAFLGFSLVFYCFFKRNMRLLLETVAIFLTGALGFSIIANTSYPIWLWQKYVADALPHYKYFASYSYIQNYASNLWLAFGTDLISFIIIAFPLIFIIILLPKVNTHKMVPSIALSSMAWCSIFIALSFALHIYEGLGRSLIFLDYALVLLVASKLIKFIHKTGRVLPITIFSCVLFTTVNNLLSPIDNAVTIWDYYKQMMGGALMPSYFHPSLFIEWIGGCFFFGLTIFWYWRNKIWRE